MTPFYFRINNVMITPRFAFRIQNLKLKSMFHHGVLKSTRSTQTWGCRYTRPYPYTEDCWSQDQLIKYRLRLKDYRQQRNDGLLNQEDWGYLPSYMGDVKKWAERKMRFELQPFLTGGFNTYVQAMESAVVNTKKAKYIVVTRCLPPGFTYEKLEHKIYHFKTHIDEICDTSSHAHREGCARIEAMFKLGAQLAVSENVVLSSAFLRLNAILSTKENQLIFMIYPNLMKFGETLRYDLHWNHATFELPSVHHTQTAEAWQLGVQSHAKTMCARVPPEKSFVSSEIGRIMMKGEYDHYTNYVQMVKSICPETQVDPKGFMTTLT